MDKAQLMHFMTGRWKARYLFPLVLAIAGLCFVVLRPQPSPLIIVSSDPNTKISVFCTYGTNHVYYHGDFIDHMLDPIIRLSGHPNAYRLRRTNDLSSTMIWVRFKNPIYNKLPPLITTPSGRVPAPGSRFPLVYAHLRDATGIESELESQRRLIKYNEGYYLGAWMLHGSLADHHGSELRITGTNGVEIATLRVP